MGCDQLVAGDDVKRRIVYLLLKGKIARLRTTGHSGTIAMYCCMALTGQVDVPVGEMCR